MIDPNIITTALTVAPFFVTHGPEIVAIITGVSFVASVVVKLTPTLKDDSIVLPVVKFISKYIALNRTVNDKDARKTQ